MDFEDIFGGAFQDLIRDVLIVKIDGKNV